MKKIFFVISRYKDNRQNIFETIISKRNKEYCSNNGYSYIEIKNDVHLPVIKNNPIWWKFHIIRDLIKNKKLNDGDIINCHDADMLITDLNAKFESDKSFTYSIDSGNTHCMGWYSLKINEWSRKLIEEITDDDRFNKLINKQTIHPKFKTYSSLWQIWAEQASWYTLAGIIRHSDVSFWNLSNHGFHSDITEDTIYSLNELQENVCILPTTYNVTEWIGESSCQFNINKIENKNDVKLRHFAGGQSWNNVVNWL